MSYDLMVFERTKAPTTKKRIYGMVWKANGMGGRTWLPND